MQETFYYLFDSVLHRFALQQINVYSFRETKRILLKFSRALLENQSKKPFVSCSVCGMQFPTTLKNGKGLRSEVVINHACSHLDTKLFICSYCDYGTSAPSTICKHVKSYHKKQPCLGNNYFDLSMDYQAEIKIILERCFGKERSNKGQIKSKLDLET